MSISRKIVWIDDNPARATTAEDLGASFMNVEKKDLAHEVEELLKGSQPRLVVVDHILDKTMTTNPLFKRGSTIAEAIKVQWPSCPVVGVTNQDIDRRTKDTYDVLFPFHDFGQYMGQIKSLYKGFALVETTRAKTARGLVQLLKPPMDEIERLVAALPKDLKESFNDASLSSRLFRWIDHLMDRPGFLYDSLWAATLLGLNESGFQKIAKQFKKGKYTGVFASDNDPRWWSSRLTELLYKRCKPEQEEMSWHVGRRLPGIKKDHFSSCYVCDKAFPEAVACLDEESKQRRSMHLKCTVLHPRYKRELYFEDIRMMQEKK